LAIVVIAGCGAGFFSVRLAAARAATLVLAAFVCAGRFLADFDAFAFTVFAGAERFVLLDAVLRFPPLAFFAINCAP